VDDRALVTAFQQAEDIEQAMRTEWQTTSDLPDRDEALVSARHARALRKTLEGWIAKRALRASLTQGVTHGR